MSFRMPTKTFAVPKLRQRVFLAGKRRSDCYCVGVSYGSGAAGSVATLELPSVGWDLDREALRGVSVRVLVRYDGGSWVCVFAGLVRSIDGMARGDSLTFEAASYLAHSDSVYIGQGRIATGQLFAAYYSSIRIAGVDVSTGWTVASILRDWFSGNEPTWRGGGGTLPSDWRSAIALGNLDAIAEAFAAMPIGDIVFRQTSLRDALEQILGLVCNLSCRESFALDGTARLDFYLLGDGGAPAKRLIVAERGASAAASNILDVGREDASEAVKTRMIGFGAAAKLIVSIQTDHATAPLVKLWDPLLEADVLTDPESAKKNASSGKAGDDTCREYAEQLGYVFRRYRLPDWAASRRWVVDASGKLTRDDGLVLEIRPYLFPTILTYTGVAGTEWTSELSTEPKQLTGYQFDPKSMTLLLAEPAINMVSGTVDLDNNPVAVFEEAVVGIGIVVSNDRIMHDTGARSSGLDLGEIADEGLVEVLVNESFQLIQVAGTIEGHDYDCWCLVDAAGDGVDAAFELFEASAPAYFRDDRARLRQLTEAALREKSATRVVYNIATPFWTDAYRLGDRVEIIGDAGADYGTHQINSLGAMLGNDHSLTITTDNQAPLFAAPIMGGGK